MTNKRKKRTRALTAKLRSTYQTAANIRRGNRGRRVDGRSTDACTAASTRATLTRILADMTEDKIRWVFRDVPELLPYLLNNELNAIAQTYNEFLAEKCDTLADPVFGALTRAETLVGQFNAVYRKDRLWMSNWHLTSRALYEAGLQSLYFRFGRVRLEACIGELAVASDPITLFKSEVEPVLRRAQSRRDSIFIELMEIPPKLSAKLGEHLRDTGWLDSTACPESSCYHGAHGEAFCRAGLDFQDCPSDEQREQLSTWRRAELVKQADLILCQTGVETPFHARHSYNFMNRCAPIW